MAVKSVSIVPIFETSRKRATAVPDRIWAWGIRMCLTGILLVILDFFLSLAKLHVGIEREYHVRQRAIATRVFFGIKTDDCSSALETIRL